MLSLLMLVASAAQSVPVVVPVRPVGSAPGHLADLAADKDGATIARNGVLIGKLEEATRRGAGRISRLRSQIELARVALGMTPALPTPPPPPPPYIQLATIAEQLDYIGQLRDELQHQQQIAPRLERTLGELRARRPGVRR